MTARTNRLHFCSCCKQQLPANRFYFTNRSTQTLDHYCKECRKAINRKHAAKDQATGIITRITDRETRIRLIIQAKQKIYESMARRLKKQRQREWDQLLASAL